MFTRIFTILPLLLLLPILLHAQGVGINTDNSVADPSAMLDVFIWFATQKLFKPIQALEKEQKRLLDLEQKYSNLQADLNELKTLLNPTANK